MRGLESSVEDSLQQQLQQQQPQTPHLGLGVRTGRWGRAAGPGQGAREHVPEHARNKIVCLEFFALTARKNVKLHVKKIKRRRIVFFLEYFVFNF